MVSPPKVWFPARREFDRVRAYRVVLDPLRGIGGKRTVVDSFTIRQRDQPIVINGVSRFVAVHGVVWRHNDGFEEEKGEGC